MKKFLKGFSAFTVIAAAVVACNSKPSMSASDVATNFSKAISVADFDSAKLYVASSSMGVFNQTEEANKAVPLPDSLKQIIAQETIKSLGETKLTDSTTSVDLSVTLPKPIMGQQELKQVLILVKEKGEWKVDLQATMQKAMQDSGMPTGGQQANPNDTVPPTPPDTGAAPQK
jgi:hypothetical protein